jgi:hypothetical protein
VVRGVIDLLARIDPGQRRCGALSCGCSRLFTHKRHTCPEQEGGNVLLRSDSR